MQFLEKENTRLESELKNVLKDLNEHKDHNDVMRDKVAHLEMNLKHNKVSVKLYFYSSNIMRLGACVYICIWSFIVQLRQRSIYCFYYARLKPVS